MSGHGTGIEAIGRRSLKTRCAWIIKSAFWPRIVFLFMIFLGSQAFLAGQAHAQADQAQFNYAELLMSYGEYEPAAREYARLIEKYPESALIANAQFKMAEAYFYAGSLHRARAEYGLFLANFSENALAAAVEARLSEISSLESEKVKVEDLPSFGGPSDGGRPQKNIGMSAVQVALFEGSGYAQIEEEIRGLRHAGIDTIILRVFHNEGDRYYPVARRERRAGVYFKSGHAPTVDDLLGRVIEIAHREGLKVFAWMTTRYADYGLEQIKEIACVGYDLNERAYKRCKGLDLFNEVAVRHLENLYSDLAEYDIDGVLFQDDLMLRHNEGFGQSAREYFNDRGLVFSPEDLYARIGGNIHYRPVFWRWAELKNKRLLEVAARLKKAVKSKRPDAVFAVNLAYETLTNPRYGLAWLSQSIGPAKEAGFDYYSIMAYHRQIEEELGIGSVAAKTTVRKMVDKAINKIGEPEKVIIKLQLVDWRNGKPLPQDEVFEYIDEVRKSGAKSLAVTPYWKGFPYSRVGARKTLPENQPAH